MYQDPSRNVLDLGMEHRGQWAESSSSTGHCLRILALIKDDDKIFEILIYNDWNGFFLINFNYIYFGKEYLERKKLLCIYEYRSFLDFS